MNIKIVFLLIFLSLKIGLKAQRLFWFWEKGKVGYKDIKGAVVIKPQFVLAGNFSEGMTYAGIGEHVFSTKYGYINTNGKWLLEPNYEAADDFSEGLARVQKAGEWGFINVNGKMIIEPQFKLCFPFKDGYARATTDNKNYGLIDTTGKFILGPKYYDLTNWDKNEQVIAVKNTISSQWELINLKEEKLSEKTFGLIRNFSEGLAAARDENDMWGFIDREGNCIIPPIYTNAGFFSEGLACIEKDYSLWGFINLKNEVIIEPGYDQMATFKGGYALVETGSEFFYIDNKGKVVLKFSK